MGWLFGLGFVWLLWLGWVGTGSSGVLRSCGGFVRLVVREGGVDVVGGVRVCGAAGGLGCCLVLIAGLRLMLRLANTCAMFLLRFFTSGIIAQRRTSIARPQFTRATLPASKPIIPRDSSSTAILAL